MANYNTTTHRSSTTTTPPPPPTIDSPRKVPHTITFSFPFNIPTTPESAAVRVVRNIELFGLYYVTFIWTILFIALIPQRKVSVVFLVATTEVAFLYSLLLRAFPVSPILHKIIDKRFVYFLLFVVAALEMILTRAAAHLFIVLGSTVPVVLLFAVVTKTEHASVVDGEAEGEMARLVQDKLDGAQNNLDV